MNCREYQELLHLYLDGAPPGPSHRDADRHLADCADCRDWHAAAQRLQDGLRLFVPAVPPSALAAQIEIRILAQTNRVRRLRRIMTGLAVAASLVVAALSGYYLLRPDRPAQLRAHEIPGEPEPSLSLQQSVAEAGQAVVSLTWRAADETMDQGRMLLPVILPGEAIAEAHPKQSQQELPDQSLLDVKQGVAEGLEPVTTSARRAMDLFLREIPPMGVEHKEGL
jgi:hypothetical protein